MRYTLFFLFILAEVTANAQNFGGNPPQKWAQINTDTVRVIFPRNLHNAANRAATIAHYLQIDSAFRYQYKKINIVLQNQTTVSNAYVQLAPYRSELFLNAPQNTFELGAIGWVDNLIVHEWRHVKQYNYFNRGVSKALGWILGQEGRALANSLVVPDWFFEGDAVLAETKLTKQGRGRLPLSFSAYKSLFLEGKNYSFQKLRNGSLRHLVPNHYDLGYLLTAYGAEKYGDDLWIKVTADAASFKGLFYPLQQSIKKHTGISYKQFVNDAFSYYSTQFKQEPAPEQERQWLTKTYKNVVQDYNHPYAAGTNSVVAVKRSYRRIPAFYRVYADGTEEKIQTKNISLDDYFAYKNGKIIYSSYYPDKRWTNRDYSNIIIFDTEAGDERKITSNSKYFSPDISNDGKKIVAVDMTVEMNSFVVLMDENGKRIQTISHGQDSNYVYSYPKFAADDASVFVLVRKQTGEMSLQQLFTDKKAKALVPFGNYILGFPVVHGDTILFTASNKTNDAIYAYISSANKLYRIASYPTGLYQATFQDGRLVTSAFTSEGNRLMAITLKPSDWKEVSAPELLIDLYVNKATGSKQTLDQLPTQRFQFKKYSTLSHPFNFHSWRPFYDPPEYFFTLYGNNVLNTMQTELSYIYNENENSNAAQGTLLYGGTFVQPFITLNHTWNRTGNYRDTAVHWNEFGTALGLQLPLTFTGGKGYRFFNLSGSYHTEDISWTGDAKQKFLDARANYIQGRLSYSSQIQKAPQQIYPHFAQNIFLQYRSATNLDATHQFLAIGNLYLPGVHATHNIVLNVAYETSDTFGLYRFDNNFPFSRGYDDGVYDRIFSSRIRFGANYHFPIVYPEFGIANIIYFTRIRGNAFYDYTEIKLKRPNLIRNNFGFTSVGGEVYFDTRWWNQLPVTFGIRYSRLQDGDLIGLQPNQWELILPVDLIR